MRLERQRVGGLGGPGIVERGGGIGGREDGGGVIGRAQRLPDEPGADEADQDKRAAGAQGAGTRESGQPRGRTPDRRVQRAAARKPAGTEQGGDGKGGEVPGPVEGGGEPEPNDEQQQGQQSRAFEGLPGRELGSSAARGPALVPPRGPRPPAGRD